jgi:hypothetical protein
LEKEAVEVFHSLIFHKSIFEFLKILLRKRPTRNSYHLGIRIIQRMNLWK